MSITAIVISFSVGAAIGHVFGAGVLPLMACVGIGFGIGLLDMMLQRKGIHFW